jgi:hypothetical protein
MNNNIFNFIGQAQGILTSPIRETITNFRGLSFIEVCQNIGNIILDSSPLKIILTSYAVLTTVCKTFNLDNQVCKTSDYIFEKGVDILSSLIDHNDNEPNLRGSYDNMTLSGEVNPENL